MTVAFRCDGRSVEVPDDGASLLEALRDRLGNRSPKDGCSPQGQCGCCTVLVDGTPRVACVTPVRRVAGREVTTLAGLPEPDRRAWAEAFAGTGASQCGFCTPGIIVRLEGLRRRGPAADEAAVGRALGAHLCRCTGWRTIFAAYDAVAAGVAVDVRGRDLAAARRRAEIEGGVPQQVGPEVALGQGGFAADTAPPGALVAVPDGRGGWAVGETLTQAREAGGKVQGRRSTIDLHHPLEVPGGDWELTLRTTWAEPAYLETDASWCEPGGEPASPLANGGAFGGKVDSPAPAVARRLADEHGRAVVVLLSREDSVGLGPKRPPLAAGMRADGSGRVVVARTPGITDAIRSVAPAVAVEEVDVPGPPTSAAVRGAGWAELAVLRAVLRAGGRGADPGSPVTFGLASGARATARTTPAGLAVSVACGDPLDEVVLRSYCVGAAHMGLSWVTSEGIAVDGAGVPHSLTIRSFGVVRAADMPPVEVEIEPSGDPPVNGSDAVLVAVAALTWMGQGCPQDWPTRRAGGA